MVPSRNTPRVQEVHITIGHVLCDLVDYLLFPEKFRREAGFRLVRSMPERT